MSKYLVKVYMRTGESISFISGEIEDSPFPDLDLGEFLYFHWADHQDLFDDLWQSGSIEKRWWEWALHDNWVRKNIQNFTVRAVPVQVSEYVGLDRRAAQEKALEDGYSFRVVLEDGMPVSVEQDYNEKRVNVYLDQGIVYKAEIF